MSKKPIFALIDCNNFFVSCERMFRPDLWDKPVAVLSNNDGCIVARSNEVKALGIPMGIPLFKVRDILNDHKVTLFSGNFQLYGDFSHRVVRILQQASPNLEVYSVDESFLELSRLGITDYAAWAADLRQKIWQWIGIPVSIGIASSKTLAKAAAEYAKKDDSLGGVHSIVADTIFDDHMAAKRHETLLRWLPIGDIWGIGWRTAPKLQARGISTAFDLSKVNDKWAQDQLSIRGLKTVKELRGDACWLLEHNDEPQQSIMCTRSFSHNVRNYFELEGAVATFAARAAAKLRAQGEVAGAVLTFLRTSRRIEDSRGASAVVRLLQPSADTGAIISAALQGLAEVYDQDYSYKKGGIVLLDLNSTSAWQLSLLESSPEKVERQAALMRSVDQINKRYSTRLVRHASEHINRTGWHSKHERRSPAYTTNWQELRKLT